jgi:hypothetical protein
MSEGGNGLSKWRIVFFRLSFASAAFSAVAAVIDWTAPFPLVSHADGSYSISPWDDRVFDAGIVLCVATIALAGFGRGIWRWLLITAGLLLSALSVFGFVGNHLWSASWRHFRLRRFGQCFSRI